MSPDLQREEHGEVVLLTLNRPHKRNALSLDLRDALAAAGAAATPVARETKARILRQAPSTWLPLRPRISAYAEDVAAGLRRLDVQECTLVGHSLGGAVATAVAERLPAVHSLVLLAPAGFGQIRLADAFALPGVRDIATLMLPWALVSPLLVTAGYTTFVAHRRLPSRDLTERLRRRAFQSAPGVRTAVTAIAAAGRSKRGFHQRPVAFDGPVAALWGEKDALVPLDHTRAVTSALPQAHLEVWERMGHHPQRERPAQLSRFIERHAAEAPQARRAATRTRSARQG